MTERDRFNQTQINDFIRFLRPVLILLVCAVHIPYIAGYTSETTALGSPQTLFSVYLKDVIARGAVPLLTVISGYLAFYSFKKYSYKSFLLKKIQTLLIPFIVFNLITFFGLYTLATLSGNNAGNINSIQTAKDFISAIFGFNRLPINPPLYFLRDLFIISIFAPLINIIVKKNYLLAACALIFIYINFDTIGVYATFLDAKLGILNRSDMVIFFIFGYFFAQRNLSIPKPNNYTAALSAKLYLLITLSICILIVAVKPSMFSYLKYRLVIGAVTLSFIPAIIAGFIYIKDTFAAKLMLRFSVYSFTLFLTHIIFVHFFTIAKRVIGISVTNQSDLYTQIVYFSLYLVGCAIFAIIIRKSWVLTKQKTMPTISEFKERITNS
tara:strand:+ start:1032 stop:2177 length:1146 start_codon:yes stop_codon:yes gene_type:complete